MGKSIEIDEVNFTSASHEDAEGGLLGFVACRLNHALKLEGITLRLTADGRPTLSWPSRRDSAGRQLFYVRPISDQARKDIEAQVFRALHLSEEKK